MPRMVRPRSVFEISMGGFFILFYFQSVKTHVELFVALLIEDQLWLLISEWQRNGKSEIDLQQVKCV